MDREDKDCGLTLDQLRSRRGWKYCFSGPTGPKLAAPSYPIVLARRLAWGVRSDEGLWCQVFEQGWPAGEPFLIACPSPIGLFAMAELDPEWFTGLPYDEDDVAKFQETSYKPVGRKLHKWHRPYPPWRAGEIRAELHPEPILPSEKLTEATIRRWL